MRFWFKGFSVLGSLVVLLVVVCVGSFLVLVPALDADDDTSNFTSCRWAPLGPRKGNFSNNGYCQNGSDVTFDCSRPVVVPPIGAVVPPYFGDESCTTLSAEDKNASCSETDESKSVTCLMTDVGGVVLHCKVSGPKLVDCVDPKFVNAILPPGSGSGQCKVSSVFGRRVVGPDGEPVSVYDSTAVCPDGFGQAFFFTRTHPVKGSGQWSAASSSISEGSALVENNCSISVAGDSAICEFAQGLRLRFVVSDGTLSGGRLVDQNGNIVPSAQASALLGTNTSSSDLQYWKCGSGVVVDVPIEPGLSPKVSDLLYNMATLFTNRSESGLSGTLQYQPFNFASACYEYLQQVFVYITNNNTVAVFQAQRDSALGFFDQLVPTDVQGKFMELILLTYQGMEGQYDHVARQLHFELQKTLGMVMLASLNAMGAHVSGSLNLLKEDVKTFVDHALAPVHNQESILYSLTGIMLKLATIADMDFFSLYEKMGEYMIDNAGAMANHFPFNEAQPAQ